MTPSDIAATEEADGWHALPIFVDAFVAAGGSSALQVGDLVALPNRKGTMRLFMLWKGSLGREPPVGAVLFTPQGKPTGALISALAS